MPSSGDPKIAQNETSANADIVVTARFREESAQDIGGSIAAFNTTAIARSGLVDISDLSRLTVGLNLLKTGPNSNDINIRGISNSRGGAAGLGSLVTVTLDDIVISGTGAATQKDLNTFDFSRIEVLRGPQPTYFGEGSVGGTIRYFSGDPDVRSGFGVKANSDVSWIKDGGTSYRAEAAINIPIVTDALALKLTGFYRKDGGFIDLPRVGVKDGNTYRSAGGRAVLLYAPDDRLQVRLAAHIARDKVGDPNQIDPTQDLTSISSSELISAVSIPERTRDDFDLYSASIRFKPSDKITLQSITGFYKRASSGQSEAAAYTLGFRFFLAAYGITGVDTTAFQQPSTKLKSFSQEFRLLTNFDGPLNFTGGAYYRKSTNSLRFVVSGPGYAALTIPSSPNIGDTLQTTDSRQISGFVEGTLSLVDSLRLIGGVRYLHQDDNFTLVSSDNISVGQFNPVTGKFPINNDLNTLQALGLSNSFKFNLREWLPRFGFEFDAMHDVMLYGNVARGLRNGGFNSVLSAVVAGITPNGTINDAAFRSALTYKPDQVWTYELGAKTRWLDDALTVNVAGYYTNYKDPQLLIGVPTALNINGPSEDIWGGELETIYRLQRRWSMFANVGYLDARFRNGLKLFPVAGAPADYQDLKKGNRPTNAPKWTISTGTDFETPLNGNGLSLFGHADFSYVSSRYGSVQNFPSTRLGALKLVNLRLGVTKDRWSLNAYVSNLFNDIELLSAFAPTNGATLVNGRLDASLSQAFVNQPRTAGLNLGVNF
jgi:outer membrane receptor protein involved in Fe transport